MFGYRCAGLACCNGGLYKVEHAVENLPDGRNVRNQGKSRADEHEFHDHQDLHDVDLGEKRLTSDLVHGLQPWAARIKSAKQTAHVGHTWLGMWGMCASRSIARDESDESPGYHHMVTTLHVSLQAHVCTRKGGMGEVVTVRADETAILVAG